MKFAKYSGKKSSLFWEENRDDEDEGYDLIRIIETVVIYYDVEWLPQIRAENNKFTWAVFVFVTG